MREILAFLAVLLFAAYGFSREPAGSWHGSWSSNSTGHRGTLRAHISPGVNGQYDARFSGRFAKVIPFFYRVKLTAIDSGPSSQTLVANKRLGPLLGSFHMTATISVGQFNASYQSRRDRGQFQLTRLGY